MSINKKILEEIDKLNISDGEKDLAVSLLEIEDNGSNRYSDEYDEQVNEFIKKRRIR